MAEAHSHGAARLLQPEALHDRLRVVVAVPYEDPPVPELLRDLPRGPIVDAKGERRRAFVDPGGVGYTEQTDSLGEPPKEALRETGLVAPDRHHPGHDRLAPRRRRPAQSREVVH